MTHKPKPPTRPTRLDVRIHPRLQEQIRETAEVCDVLASRITRSAMVRELSRRMEAKDRIDGVPFRKWALCEGCWEWLEWDEDNKVVPHTHKGRTYKGEE